MENLPISSGDIAVILILLLSALLAFLRGFVREVLSIAGWVGAALVTIWAFPQTTWFMRQYISIELLADVVTGVGIFVVTLIALSAVSHYIAKGVRGSAVNAVDRSLGFLFGLLRGAVLVSLAYLLVVYFYPEPDQRPAWIREARSEPWLSRGAEVLRQLVPDDRLDEGFRQIDTARDQVERGADAVQMIQEITPQLSPSRPAPAPQGMPNEDAPEDEAGYNQPQRDQMNRLIENMR